VGALVVGKNLEQSAIGIGMLSRLYNREINLKEMSLLRKMIKRKLYRVRRYYYLSKGRKKSLKLLGTYVKIDVNN